MPLVCKTRTRKAGSVIRPKPSSVVGSNPTSSAKLFNNALLYRFSLIFARFVPIRRFALRANSGFADGIKARDPFVLAAATFVSFLFDRDHAHEWNNILDKDIPSREKS